MQNLIKPLFRRTLPAGLRSRIEPPLMRALYSGDRYACPLCASGLKKLLPMGLKLPVLEEKHVIGGGYRLNALCPVCDSSDRERLVYLWLKQKTDLLDRPQRILHLAPEPSLSALFLRMKNPGYLTGDLMNPAAMVRIDVTRIPYDDGHFEAVICNHVLEHVPDDAKAMRELRRVLKPGGRAVRQVPISATRAESYEDDSITDPTGREAAFGQIDHVRIYGHADYPERLRRAGFDVSIFDWNSEPEHFGGAENRFALNPDERLYTATRP